MALLWTANLKTGIDWQDEQHQELFDRIGKLIDGMTKGAGKDEISELFSFLDSYVVKHFGQEEEKMKKLNYPDKDSHLAEHKTYVDEIRNLEERVKENIDTKLLIDTQKTVVDWLRSHIGKTDKALALFLLENDK